MHMLKLGWVTLWEAAWPCHLKQYCAGQCRQYGWFCWTDLWVHGGGIGVLMLKRSESNSCYTKAPKRFLYGEWGGGCQAQPIAVLDNLETTPHSNSSWTVLHICKSSDPSLQMPPHMHTQTRQYNICNYTQKLVWPFLTRDVLLMCTCVHKGTQVAQLTGEAVQWTNMDSSKLI